MVQATTIAFPLEPILYLAERGGNLTAQERADQSPGGYWDLFQGCQRWWGVCVRARARRWSKECTRALELRKVVGLVLMKVRARGGRTRYQGIVHQNCASRGVCALALGQASRAAVSTCDLAFGSQ